jgi:hypothetical protein
MGEVPTERVFGFSNMFVAPEEDPRPRVNYVGEREALTGYLRNYRTTLELKCAGLDPAELAARSVPPSDLSLLGLVRHLADVERFWFREVLAQGDRAPLFFTEEKHDADLADATGDQTCVDHAWQMWRDEVAFAEGFLVGADDLGASVTFPPDTDMRVEVRDVVIHMIEEYARHLGHADLLRERIDGRVGQ